MKNQPPQRRSVSTLKPEHISSEAEYMRSLAIKLDKKIESLEVPNTRVYQIAVYSISVIAILLVVSSVAIVLKGQDIPDAIAVALGTTLGAISGMLVPTQR